MILLYKNVLKGGFVFFLLLINSLVTLGVLNQESHSMVVNQSLKQVKIFGDNSFIPVVSKIEENKLKTSGLFNENRGEKDIKG